MARIAFFSGPSWERWDDKSPLQTGIGGSETCLVYLTRELSKKGHDVTLFIDTSERKNVEGVKYHPFRDFEEFKEEVWDYLILYRNLSALALQPKARIKIGFAQDVTLTGCNGEFSVRGEPLSKELDYLIALSRPHQEYMANVHRFPIDRILLSANAVDPMRYQAVDTVQKKRGQVFYSSCPSRNLDILMAYGSEIKKQVPEFKIVTAYGMQTWEGLLRTGRGDYRQYFFTLDAMKRLDFVEDRGRVGQQVLADLQMESWAWLYPTEFPETYCITATEAGFAKCPIVASKHFGLISTVGQGGILIDPPAHGSLFKSAFVDHAVRLMRDDEYWATWSKKSYEQAQRFTWENVGNQWDGWMKTGVWRNLHAPGL